MTVLKIKLSKSYALQDSMVWVEALIPFDKGELLSTIHQVGMVARTVSIRKNLN